MVDDKDERMSEELNKGDYVLATKYGDGDPGDQFSIGFYDRFQDGRHYVVDGDGKQFRGNGFRRCERIAREVGEWLVTYASFLEASQAGRPIQLNIWGLIDSVRNRELLASETAP